MAVGTIGGEEFIDVPDPIVDIRVISRNPGCVLLRWSQPCCNGRVVGRYQVHVERWRYGRNYSRKPLQLDDGHLPNAAVSPEIESAVENLIAVCWSDTAGLLQLSAAEVLTPTLDTDLCQCKLMAPAKWLEAWFGKDAARGQFERSPLFPAAVWVVARAENAEGWSDWSEPAFAIFQEPEPCCELQRRPLLHTWGLAEDGRLGLGQKVLAQNVCAEAQLIESLREKRVASFALGSHSAVITGDDQLYVWGTFLGDADSTHSGSGDRSDGDSVEVLVEPGVQTTHFVPHAVACGRFVTAVISADGRLYTWGPNDAHQCGLQGDGSVVREVAEVEVPKKTPVVSVALGEFHGVALSAHGQALAWGMEQGPEVATGATPKFRPRIGVLVPPITNFNQPVPRVVDVPQLVRAVAAGGYHSVVLTEFGQVWTWGSNDNGQLGHGVEVHFSARPRIVEGLGAKTDHPIMSVSLGGFHSAAVDEVGSVFTWGANQKGQCGHGDLKVVPVPTMVEFAPGRHRCVSVSCGGRFTFFAVVSEENVDCAQPVHFACGLGKEGCLGFGQPCKRMTRPRRVPLRQDGQQWMCIKTGMAHVAGLSLARTTA